MTPARSNSESAADASKWTQFWKVATALSVIGFPAITAAGGYFAGKVLEHDTSIAVMRASYTTKEETETRENGLKQSIDALKQTINELRVEIVKVTSLREHDGR